MEDGLKALVTLLQILGPVGAGVFLLLFFPEKLEKWSAILWRGLGHFFDGAHKKYVKHDLQGRVNDFIRRLSKDVPGLSTERLTINWVDPSTERQSFISEGKVVLRLRKNDPQDHNFVHGVYHWVRCAFLRQSKQYLSKSQGESIDLFTCTKLIESEKPSVLDFFLETYLHPATEGSKNKVKGLLVRMESLNEAGLFFPVFIQEMKFLGQKVFGKVRTEQIVEDVAGALSLLENFAAREIGQEGDTDFNGRFCRFSIAIVGKASKMRIHDIAPYVRYLKSQLEAGFETIYVLAPRENTQKIEKICIQLNGIADVCRSCQIKQNVKKDGERIEIDACLFVIRKKRINVIAKTSPATT